MITKYHNTDLDALISLAESKGANSPLIVELARRLDEQSKQKHDMESNTHVECPCCEAPLMVGYDDHNGIYSLEVGKNVN